MLNTAYLFTNSDNHSWQVEMGGNRYHTGLLLNSTEVVEVADTYENHLISVKVNGVDNVLLEEQLQDTLEKFPIEDTDILEHIKELVYSLYPSSATIEELDDYPLSEDVVVYTCMGDCFANLKDWGTLSQYNYWDGNNYKSIEFDTNEYITVEYNEDQGVNLDHWDGSNWYTNNKFEHQNVYKIVREDGSESSNYMVTSSSDYQGSLLTATRMDAEELTTYLTEIGRQEELARLVP